MKTITTAVLCSILAACAVSRQSDAPQSTPGPPVPRAAPDNDVCATLNHTVATRVICRTIDHPKFWRAVLVVTLVAAGIGIYRSVRIGEGCPPKANLVTDPISGKRNVYYTCQ